ncbi:MAG: hypothetical protein F6K42_22480 [Leptolyngbya sp. SIO1D8]|nr:hypothetical protein [Leptolyngbya sp. SIO1D8]
MRWKDIAPCSSRLLPAIAPLFQKPTVIWLGLSLAIALLYCLPALYTAFSGEYVVQDDARQHVFWMQRFTDPGLFPQDLFADYFQSVAPWGYTQLYQGAVSLGLDLWTVNKLLPIVITLTATAYAFGTVLQLVPIPPAGFVTTVFLNQTFIERDDIVSATPAAFFYPLFLAFLYYLLKKAWFPCVLSIVLLGLFYPQGVPIMALVLGFRLLQWQQGRLRFSQMSADYWLWGIGWLVALGVLLPYLLQDSAYGPVLTPTQGQDMFALSSEGWSRFFVEDARKYWICGKRSGLVPTEWCENDLKILPQIWLSLALPVILAFPGRSRLTRLSTPGISLLFQAAAASTICFAAAHLFLFNLHLPNRYTEHSFRILVALGMGIAIALLLDRFPPSRRQRIRSGILLGVSVWAIVTLMLYTFVKDADDDPIGHYVRGEFPQLYAYFRGQPKDIQIASLSREVNVFPSFAQRSIFVGGEGYTLPYHMGFYNEVRQRTISLIEAQYSFDPARVYAFLLQYPIDFWLIERTMFTAQWIQKDEWLKQYALETTAPQTTLKAGQLTVIQTLAKTCTTLEVEEFQVLDANCLRQVLKPMAVDQALEIHRDESERTSKSQTKSG